MFATGPGAILSAGLLISAQSPYRLAALDFLYQKRRKPRTMGECEAIRTASLGVGGGLAVGLMSGQRIKGKWSCRF